MVPVVARMVSSFPVKNVLKSSTVWVTDVDATGRSNEFILFQKDPTQDTCRWLTTSRRLIQPEIHAADDRTERATVGSRQPCVRGDIVAQDIGSLS